MSQQNTAMARVGKYLMLDLLGEGAFGKVRLAVDETSGKEYAIKIMQKSHIKANELTLQVRREIAVMKAMTHPNIVNLHEVLTSSNNLYMVMDLVTGGELFDAVAEEGRIPENHTRSYFQQLVDGVTYCHSRRVYHRDLKPENLLLSADKQTLKITDFGLSSIKAQNASSELLHTIMGSPHYIPPEIITSAASGYDGAKVDVWASGVILFGMLAGYLPFDQPTTRALYKAIVQDPVKYPPHFSYDVIKLLKAMLQKDPDMRPTMEHVKTFTWFKVSYQPVGADDKGKSGEKPERRKLRHKLRKHGDRSGKKKKERDEDTLSALHALKLGRRRREVLDAEALEEAKLTARSSAVVEVCTSNLEEEIPFVAGVSTASRDDDKHTKENVDPARQAPETGEPHDKKASDQADSFLDRSDPSRNSGKINDGNRIFSRPNNSVKSFGRSSEGSRSKSGEESGKLLGLDPGRSFTKLSNAARSFTKSRLRHSTSGSQKLGKEVLQSSFSGKESGTASDKLDNAGTASHGASFSSQHSTTQTDDTHDIEGLKMTLTSSGTRTSESRNATEMDKDSMLHMSSSQPSSRCSQPLSRGGESSSGKDAVSSDSASVKSSSGENTERSHKGSQESDAGMPLSTPKVGSSDFEPASLTDFISPISVSSRMSFSSIAHKKTPGGRRARCSLPTNFDSPISRIDLQTPRAVVPSLDDDSCVPSVRGFDEGVTPVNSLVNSAIFKPMSGLLESLAQRTPKTNKESMSPSVFCPEVEGDDVEGTSEWCIDSVEVFADVEPPEKKDAPIEEPEAVKTVEESVSSNPSQSSNSLKRMDSSSLSIIDAAKPIFGPLDSALELKLSPSMEAEATGTAAVRSFPPAHTKE